MVSPARTEKFVYSQGDGSGEKDEQDGSVIITFNVGVFI